MNQELSKLQNFFTNHYADKIDSFTKLSYNSNDSTSFVNCEEKAYNFDKIVKSFFVEPPYSVDAIYLKDKIYLIEFKDSSIEESNDKLKMILKVKLCSSLLVLENFISKVCACDMNKIKIYYLIVANSSKNPKMALSTTLKNISKISDNPFLSYQIEVNGYRIYCDKCIICNELNFMNYLV